MPTINKQQKKSSSPKKVTDMKKLRATAYNNIQWRKMRDSYLKLHPLCEECLRKGKITPAEDVHHIRSPFSKGDVNYTLLLDYDNLMSVCKNCHADIHNKQLGHVNPEEIIRQLDALLDESISDKDIEDGNY